MSSVGKLLLAPLALPYWAVVQIRAFLYDTKILPVYNSSLPVISIGNVTVGGTGKTPLTEWIVAFLLGRGRRPVILSRGYGGSLRGPHLVQQGDDAALVGDEPVMMASALKVPVVISRVRSEGARFIEARGIGDIIVLDDGLQHRALGRDLDIISIDCSTEAAVRRFESGWLLPAGELREPRDAALRRGGLIVLNHRGPRTRGAEDREARVRALLPPRVPTVTSFSRLVALRNEEGSELSPGPISVVTGIAHPEGFVSTLKDAGYEIKTHLCFPDHHKFTSEDLDAMSKAGREHPLVTNRKDRVRISGPLAQTVYVAQTETMISDDDVMRGLLTSGFLASDP